MTYGDPGRGNQSSIYEIDMEGRMDPVTLIVAALVAGAAKGAGTVATTAITDAYKSLKGLVARRLSADSAGQKALQEHEEKPQESAPKLKEALSASGASHDQEILAAAKRVMELADPGGAASGKYTVNLPDAKGVQVGDNNEQHNAF